MLTIHGQRNRFCDGVSRRDFLKIGAAACGGLSISAADVLRARAASSNSPRAVIMVCLPGGPTHIDTYDMKPDAAEEVRGEFRPIATNVPGMHICEHMPLQARIADKFAVVRNMRFTQPDHELHEVFTGFPALARRPAFGSIVSRLREGEHSLLPQYMTLSLSDHPRTVARAEKPMYAGLAHAPFEPTAEFMNNLRLPAAAHLSDRRNLLQSFDHMRRELDANGQLDVMDRFSARALEMVTSSAVRDALDLSKESDRIRDRYGPDIRARHNYQFGHTWNGSRFLLARRLVEAGVPVVTLAEMGWDHHGNLNEVRGTIFERSAEQLPWLDRSLHALVTDLHERGLERDVAVLVWGEFGRTPRVNRFGGRDHWTPAGFAWFAGGGFRTGQMIGETDPRGERPRGKSYGPQNVFATLYHHLGINTTETVTDFTGRPRHLLDEHEVIRELVG